MTRTALPTTSIRITIKWEKMLILTAQFFDFFACFLREEFFVIKFRRTSSSDKEMQPLVGIFNLPIFLYFPKKQYTYGNMHVK